MTNISLKIDIFGHIYTSISKYLKKFMSIKINYLKKSNLKSSSNTSLFC